MSVGLSKPSCLTSLLSISLTMSVFAPAIVSGLSSSAAAFRVFLRAISVTVMALMFSVLFCFGRGSALSIPTSRLFSIAISIRAVPGGDTTSPASVCVSFKEASLYFLGGLCASIGVNRYLAGLFGSTLNGTKSSGLEWLDSSQVWSVIDTWLSGKDGRALVGAGPGWGGVQVRLCMAPLLLKTTAL